MLAIMTDINHQIAEVQGELIGFLRKRARGEPEEVAQEVWLRVTKAGPDIPDLRQFRAYVFTVARRVLIDRHRRRRARVELVQMDGTAAERKASSGDSPEAHVHAQTTAEAVQVVLQSMNPEMAQVFRWRVFDDVAFKEIAERQNCSINTALGRMHRATKLIAAALREQGIMGGEG